MGSSFVVVFGALVVIFLGGFGHQAEARAFFVFGDSLVDNGNNNYLATTARADSYPYGIDYPTHRATGRFSNGYNIPDLLSEAIGSEPTLPYLSPELTGEKLLVGANFASAGIGILNDTGIQFLNIIRIYKQLEYFQQYQTRVGALIGAEQAERLVSESLILITLGGNDFVNNYYLVPFSARSRQFALPDYVVYLISEYRKVLARLYELGARRVLVTGTGPLGCVPAELALRSRNGECAVELQRAAALFNPQLADLINNLNSEIGTTIFIAANAFSMHMDFISNPRAYGFVTSKVACCGQGPYNGIGLCTIASNLCSNRDIFAFWDAFHPSERANRIIVRQILEGDTKYMNPMNLSTIMALDSSQILQYEKSAAGVLCQLKARHGTQAANLPMIQDVMGIVAMLGKVDDDNLSRLLSEYLGMEYMLAIVCKTFEGVRALEVYDREGCINKSTGLHGLGASIGRALEGRFHVFCLENLRPYVGDFIPDDPQRRLDLLKPRLANGECPPGFLGFAVNMINLDVSNLFCVTARGRGLRETLFYNLFSRLQVYQTRADMLHALPCISDGAISLDGGMIRATGVFSLGNRQDVGVKFPRSSMALSLSESFMASERQIQELKWKKEKMLEDIKREQAVLDNAKLKFDKKKQEFIKFLVDSSSYVSQQHQMHVAQSSLAPR